MACFANNLPLIYHYMESYQIILIMKVNIIMAYYLFTKTLFIVGT